MRTLRAGRLTVVKPGESPGVLEGSLSHKILVFL
jgi:hypothetical protein